MLEKLRTELLRAARFYELVRNDCRRFGIAHVLKSREEAAGCDAVDYGTRGTRLTAAAAGVCFTGFGFRAVPVQPCGP